MIWGFGGCWGFLTWHLASWSWFGWVNPISQGVGDFRKMQFTQNFSKVSDSIINWHFGNMQNISFDTSFGILLGPALGALKLKKCDFGKIPIGQWWPYSSSENKVTKQKTLVLLSGVCQNFWPQIKTWLARAKEHILRFSGLNGFAKTKNKFKLWLYCSKIFWRFFSSQPVNFYQMNPCM